MIRGVACLGQSNIKTKKEEKPIPISVLEVTMEELESNPSDTVTKFANSHSKKRKLNQNAELPASYYYKIRLIARQLRPHFIEVYFYSLHILCLVGFVNIISCFTLCQSVLFLLLIINKDGGSKFIRIRMAFYKGFLIIIFIFSN